MEKELEKALEIIRKEAVALLIEKGEKTKTWEMDAEKKLENGLEIHSYTDVPRSTTYGIHVNVSFTPTPEEFNALEERSVLGVEQYKEKRRAELLAELAKLDEKEGEE